MNLTKVFSILTSKNYGPKKCKTLVNYLDDGDDETKRYQLQIDDDKLWQDVKKKATACGITIGIGITELLRYWVRGEFDDLDKE